MLDRKIAKIFGLDEMVDRVESGCCPFCGNKVNLEDFKDELSFKEFDMSGLCQKCQDGFFTPEMEENLGVKKGGGEDL